MCPPRARVPGYASATRTPLGGRLQELLTRFYEPHQTALTRAVEAVLQAHGRCLMLDGHSFPAHPLPYEDDQNPDRPDICIGTDTSHTPAALRDIAVRTFQELGWSVAVDRPFSGALVPLRFHQSDLRVAAIMVEVNRRLYMDERSGVRLACFDGVRERLGQAVKTLVAAAG